MRIPKTLTVEKTILEEIEQTKGDCSTSERVNELLRLALAQERQEELKREAELFFSHQAHRDRDEEHSFQKASMRSLARE